MNKFLHELEFRGDEAMARLEDLRVSICGVGAVGSLLADQLARQGVGHLRVIDNDRVEEHNTNTQLYGLGDVGAWKVDVLRNQLFRSVGVELEAHRKSLTDRTARGLLKGCDLVVDALDNAPSRQLVQTTSRSLNTPCLHVGLAADYFEVVWDGEYQVPIDVGRDVCEYPLARNLVLFAVAIAAESIVRFAVDDDCQSRSGTLRDFAVLTSEPA